MKLFRNIMTFATLVLLSACSMTVRNDVSSFHHMTAPNGESVAIIPMSLSQDPDSLEFKEYASLVSKQLIILGYTTADIEDADLIVEFGYTVTRERNNRRNLFDQPFGMLDPWYGAGYGYYNWYHWRRNAFFYNSFYDPFYGPWGHGFNNDVTHNRHLMLDIRKAGGEKIYEGRVESLGRSKDLQKVLPFMIEAMFTNFPGESGEVKQIVIREEPEKK